MLKSCKYCGRIHDSKFDCGRKPKYRGKPRQKEAVKFRSSQAWTDKSIEIRKRDHYLCQCCLRDFPGTVRRLNSSDLSVHHVVPIEEDYGRRLDNENLLTLCGYHHELSENGKISRKKLQEIAEGQERGVPPGV